MLSGHILHLISSEQAQHTESRAAHINFFNVNLVEIEILILQVHDAMYDVLTRHTGIIPYFFIIVLSPALRQEAGTTI